MEPSEPQSAEAWFKAGTDFYYLQFNDKQALRCFTEAINLNPDYYQAYAERGNTHRALKNTQDALADLDKSIRVHENPSAQYIRARILYKSGQKEEARKVMELAEELRPKEFLSYIHKAEILIDFESREEAVVCCDKAIEFEPMMAHTYYLKGSALGPSKPKEALDCVDRAIKLNPNGAIYYRLKACCLLALGNPQEALICCEEARMLNPNDSENYGCKARVLAATGKIQEALQCYDHGIRLNPTDHINHMEKAILLLQCGDVQGAITSYKQALQSDPGNAVAYYNTIGCIYADFLDPRQSIEYFDQAIRLNPNDASSFINKGSSYFVMTLYQQAAECFDRAIRLDAMNVQAHTYKGASLIFMKKHREGIACFDHAISLGIKNVDIYNNKGKALSELGLNEEAIACYNEGIKEDSNDALVYLNKAELLHKLGKDQEAIENYGRAYELIEIEYQKLIQIHGPEGFGDEAPKARTALMKKFMGLQEIITETEQIIMRIDSANPTSVKLIRNLHKLKEQRGKLMSKFIESLSMNKKKQASAKELNDQIALVAKIEKEMIALKQEVTQLQGGSQIMNKSQTMNKSQIQEIELLSESEASEKFRELEAKNPQVYSYCKTFYWTLINLFGAYKFLGTGSVQGNLGDDTAKGKLLARGAHSLSNHAVDIVMASPFEGPLLIELDNIIDSLYISANENNNKMNLISKLLQNKFGPEFDVSLPVAKLAFAVTKVRERAITHPMAASPTIVHPTSQLFKNKVANIKDGLFNLIELSNKIDFSATLGLEDALLLVVYLCRSYVAVNSSNVPLDVHCANVVKLKELEQILGTGENKRPVEAPPQSCNACNMF